MLFGIVDQGYPNGNRYAVDCPWIADAVASLAGLAQVIATAPSVRSNAIGVIYGPSSALRRTQPYAALSVMGRVIGIGHGTWGAWPDDAANLDCLRAGMDALDPVTKGRPVGPADLARPGEWTIVSATRPAPALPTFPRSMTPRAFSAAAKGWKPSPPT